jgi:hypothetical protein
MRLSLSVVRKYAPIRWCALNREWSFGPANCQHVWALNHNASKLWSQRFLKKTCYDRKPSLEENRGKIADFRSSARLALKSRSRAVSVERHSVEYSHFRAAGCPKIGWRTILSSHTEHEKLLIERWMLLSVHAHIRLNRKKYALI